MKVVFRAEGYQKIGTGHIVRCLAFADMIKNVTVEFVLQNRDEALVQLVSSKYKTHLLSPTDDSEEDLKSFLKILDKEDVVVLDGYMFKEKYQEGIKEKIKGLVVIDDLNDCQYVCDYLINHAESFDTSSYKFRNLYSKAYVGSRYALLRKSFLELAKKPMLEVKKIKSALICLGGADPANYSLKVVEALIQLDFNSIKVILGPSNAHAKSFSNFKNISVLSNLSENEMAREFQSTDCLILTGSGVVLEGLAARKPIAAFVIADNQIPVVESWCKRGVLSNCGDLRKINSIEIKKNLDSFLNLSESQLFEMQKQQVKYVDGQSDVRINQIIGRLLSCVELRLASANDSENIRNWRNLPEIRENSFHKQVIDEKQHSDWFQRVLLNPDQKLFIAEVANAPVGVLRLDNLKVQPEINIYVLPEMWGRGFGSQMLLSADKWLLENTNARKIIAKVLKENSTSEKMFLKTGYVLVKNENDHKVFEKNVF